MERWVPIKGWETLYEISDHGRLKCLRRYVRNGPSGFYRKEKITTGSFDRDGYKTMHLRLDNKRTCVKLHRLTAMYFVENPGLFETVDHLDFNKANNHYKNLAWKSQAANHSDAAKAGRMSGNGKNLIEMHKHKRENQKVLIYDTTVQ